MAFEYGTTLDNLLWWKMVTPTGELITIERENHPRHKIMPDETAVFAVKDISGGVRNVVHLRGDEIRGIFFGLSTAQWARMLQTRPWVVCPACRRKGWTASLRRHAS